MNAREYRYLIYDTWVCHYNKRNRQETKRTRIIYMDLAILVSQQPRFRATAVVQWVRALASQAWGWVFESLPRQTYVVKIGSDSSTAKCLARGVSVTGPRR